jgi:hypothetical protein
MTAGVCIKIAIRLDNELDMLKPDHSGAAIKISLSLYRSNKRDMIISLINADYTQKGVIGTPRIGQICIRQTIILNNMSIAPEYTQENKKWDPRLMKFMNN